MRAALATDRISGMKILSAGAALSLLLLPLVDASAQTAPAAPALQTADQSGVRAIALEIRRQASGRTKKVYADRGYWPLWIVDGQLSPAADRFIEIAATSQIDGLNPKQYRVDQMRAAVAAARPGTVPALVRAELLLSKYFSRYVRDIRGAPGKMRFLDEELIPGKMRDDEVLRRAALATDFTRYVMRQGWMSPEYFVLRDALLRAQGRAAGPQEPVITAVQIPPGPLLRPGARGERVALLRRRLGLAEGDRFDAELGVAVEAFQKEHGLAADKLVGAQTLAVLNFRPPEDREDVLRINLERARQLPGPWTRHVVVNAAAGELAWYEDGEEKGRMKVVVGTSETPTPMLAGMITYATLNPYWNVPVDLARKTIAPAVLKGASLDEMGYQALSDWTAHARVVDPATVDWAAVAAGTRQLRLRKLPGPTNAMGKVKFMFPNDLGIYLHDTPSRNLFSHADRQFSNGCIRLENADALGRWFFGKDLVADSDRPEQHRPLPQSVPVYITYITAVPNGGSGVRYLADVYNRDTEAFPPGASQMAMVDLGG